MRRKTAVRLYRFLFVMQIVALCVGSAKAILVVSSGVYKYIPASLVGFVIGIGLSFMWFRQLRNVEATSEDDWNGSWHTRE